MPTSTSTRPMKSTRFGVRATLEQEALLRRAAAAAHASLTDFILDSACRAAEQTLLNQRLFLVEESRLQSFLEVLDRPEADNPGLRELFSRPSPWDAA